MTEPLLEAIGVTKTYRAGGHVIHAVDGVSLRVMRGETLGLVGESGCGKSTLGRCLLRLLPLTAGSVRFDGRDISTLSMRTLRGLRPDMQMVFQDPYASLNPRRRVGDLIAEPLRVHPDTYGKKRRPADIAARIEEVLHLVGLDPTHLVRYPHEFSGGQRQRIGIARALTLSPALLIADEPVSALDVSVQAQIVNLLMDLRDTLGLTMLFIAHDLAVIRQVSTRAAVMYLGGIIETGPTLEIFAHPAHPYTAALLAAASHRAINLREDAPSLAGCRFHPRCPKVQPRCREVRPALAVVAPGREVACHFPW